MARPTKYTEELADKICEAIANSSRGLVSICNELELNASTVYRWLVDNKEFCNKYARAREIQADFMADEILEISDNGTNDTIIKDGVEVQNHEWIARSRLRVDSRKWLASKLAPKKYSDKVELDHKSDGKELTQWTMFPKDANKKD